MIGGFGVFKENNKIKTNTITGTVLTSNNQKLVIVDENNIIYSFNDFEGNLSNGDRIAIEYTGLLNENSNIVSYTPKQVETDENGIPKDWLDNGIFSQYYILAYNKLKTLTLDE